MIKHYLTVALRNLWKYKTQSIISVLGLVASIVCFAWCSYFYRVYGRDDRVFPTFNRMADLVVYDSNDKVPEGKETNVSYPNRSQFIQDIQATHIAGIEALACYNGGEEVILSKETGNDSEKQFIISAILTNNDFMRVFPTRVLEGSLEEYAQRKDAIALTPALAKRLFPHQSAIGRTLFFHGNKYRLNSEKQLYTIVAIVDQYPLYSSGSGYRKAEAFIHTGNYRSLYRSRILLEKSSSCSSVNEQIGKMPLHTDHENLKAKVHLCSKVPIKRVPLFTLLLVMGLLVLCVGFVNYLSFTISSFFNRGREMTLRRTLGAKPYQQYLLLFSNLFIILLSVLLLVCSFIELGIPKLCQSLPANISQIFFVDPSDLTHYLLQDFVLLLCLSALAVFVSLTLVKRRIARHRFRNLMLEFQFFVTLLFFLGVMGVSWQNESISRRSLGMLTKQQAGEIIKVSISNSSHLEQHHDEIHQHLSEAPYTESIGRCDDAVANILGKKDNWNIYTKFVDKTWLSIMNYPHAQKVEDGHPFAFYCNHSKSIVERYSLEGTISLDFNGYGQSTYPLLGGIEYYQFEGSSFEYLLIASNDELSNFNSDWLVKLKKGSDVKKIKRELTQYLQAMVPDTEELSPIQTVAESSYVEDYRIINRILTICTIITLLITLLGLYGSITLDTERRQKEVAIRKVNGAKVRHIYWLFGQMYVTLFAIAAAVACALALGVVLYLSKSNDLLFNYWNPLPWLLVLAVAAGFIFVTVAYRIYKIARINPADIIKTE